MTQDPHGYGHLHAELTRIAQELDRLGQPELGDQVRYALRFFGTGSPSEYVGESRLALEGVLADSTALPDELRARIAEQVMSIRQGQDAVGGRSAVAGRAAARGR